MRTSRKAVWLSVFSVILAVLAALAIWCRHLEAKRQVEAVRVAEEAVRRVRSPEYQHERRLALMKMRMEAKERERRRKEACYRRLPMPEPTTNHVTKSAEKLRVPLRCE